MGFLRVPGGFRGYVGSLRVLEVPEGSRGSVGFFTVLEVQWGFSWF